MAKFAVGEIALFVRKGSRWNGEKVEITRVGPFKVGEPDPDVPIFPILFPHDYVVAIPGRLDDMKACKEEWLRKLPGDSTSLPSWLTNMLKVPQGDPDKVKQPEKVK